MITFWIKQCKLKSRPELSLDALFGVDTEETIDTTHVKGAAVSAMNILMLHNKQGYLIQIERLASVCANLLEQGSSVPDLVDAMETSMAASHQKALDMMDRFPPVRE